MSTRPGPPGGPVQVTVVESASCHYCADAREALRELAENGHDVEVRTVALADPAGQDLMRRHGAGMSPLVLVDGEFFSQGRLPRRKLARLLEDPAGRRLGSRGD